MSGTKKRILATLQRGQGFLASLAAVSEDGVPCARYVVGTIDDDLTIRFATGLHSKKVTHVRAKPDMHIACDNIDPDVDAPYFQLEGKAEVSTDVEEKEGFRHEGLAYYCRMPANPNWCVLRVPPHRITVHSMTSMDAEVWTK